ncbi:hypothetical protein SHJG_p249 (plasmid) [Streptomyces hygroscopicus subsp. jinggangensis 5008]|nr:hypothetical protein SHJG_p249 [Streptomyces hygroscopicus subsp. jinggangensis 5008]AGF68518.1 hypothetical protein SHJGH_p249 [Streptomyces hygroscopicus subsp. jinggangensis TL01]
MNQLFVICQRHSGPGCSVCSGKRYTSFQGEAAEAAARRIAATADRTAAASRERARRERRP